MSDENNELNPEEMGDDWAAAMDEQTGSESADDDWAAAMDERCY